ncbi:3462_t:CDS:2, partial [Gigaspora rosea]
SFKMKYYLPKLIILGLFFVTTSTNGLMKRAALQQTVDADFKFTGVKDCGNSTCGLATVDSISVAHGTLKSCAVIKTTIPVTNQNEPSSLFPNAFLSSPGWALTTNLDLY